MLVFAGSMDDMGMVGEVAFMGLRVMVRVLGGALLRDLGEGRFGWGGCGRRGSVY